MDLYAAGQKMRTTTDGRQNLAHILFWPAARTVLGFFLLVLAGAPGALAGHPPQKQESADESVCSKTASYDCYTNHKYGYVLAWPKQLLTAMGESDAGDGQLFNAPDG